jgi:hypothetical protein
MTKGYGSSLDCGFYYDSMNGIAIFCGRQHVYDPMVYMGDLAFAQP